MAQIEHHRVSTNGIELHVAQTGPLDGPLALEGLVCLLSLANVAILVSLAMCVGQALLAAV